MDEVTEFMLEKILMELRIIKALVTLAPSKDTKCPTCKGAGTFPNMDAAPPLQYPEYSDVMCPTCNGSGAFVVMQHGLPIRKRECPECGGSGFQGYIEHQTGCPNEVINNVSSNAKVKAILNTG